MCAASCPFVRSLIRLTALGVIVSSVAAGAADKPAAADGAAKEASNSSAGVRPENQRTFELTVVGLDGKALSGISVECRGRPQLTKEQITTGDFVRRTNYGSMVKTDAKGHVALKLPLKMDSLDFFIESPGYGPYWAGWESREFAEPIPPTLTAELDPAWSIGGIVVDEAGRPVQGATLRPRIEFKKRPGNTKQLSSGREVKSNAEGKWQFDCVPDSMRDVQFEIHHPQFKPGWRTLTRAEFGIAPGAAPAAKLALDPGLTVTGTVTDEAGNPIAGARIRAKFANDVREAKTGSDGTYRLTGCDHITARIVAWAKGRATDMQELRVEPDMKPVDFHMKPGGTIRIRVVDSQGNPVPKARILLQRWRGPVDYFEFGIVDEYADRRGVWEWHEAPLDEFKADICPRNVEAMTLAKQSLIARPEEYVFKLPPPLVISGKVVDAESKKPVETFQVVWGIRAEDSHITWVRSPIHMAHEGKYELRPSYDYPGNLVRIEAEGYLPAVSRDVANDEGTVHVDFELKKGKSIAATLLAPDGSAAGKAKVALGIAGSQINIKNGDIDDGQTYCERRTTDEAGHFSFPPQDGDFQLIITHPLGFAHIVSKSGENMRAIIKLTPWARVEGTFRIGSKPAPNVPIAVNIQGHDVYGDRVPHIFTTHEVTSGPDGRFVFERVFPGRGWIGREITLTVNDGAADVVSSCKTRVEFSAGETARLNVGGTGRAVVGRLRPPESYNERVPWNFALINMQVDQPAARNRIVVPRPIPGPGERAMADLAQSLYVTATVDRDGRFRIDDLPAGGYVLSAYFEKPDRNLGSVQNFHLLVPPANDRTAEKALDLGTIQLK